MSRLFQIAQRCQDLHGVEWFSSEEPVPYPVAVSVMEDRIARIGSSELPEAIWLLEHPPLYTAGTSARDDELLSPNRLPVYRTGRGGRYTYHGPGQRVAYVMLDLRRRGADVRAFVHSLEGWIIEALAAFGLRCDRREGRIGIWVETADGKEAKIAAIGVRVRRWISYHGIAINVSPDLSAFGGIVPCGLADFDVTSMQALGVPASLADVDLELKRTFPRVFPPAVLEITSLQTPGD